MYILIHIKNPITAILSSAPLSMSHISGQEKKTFLFKNFFNIIKYVHVCYI
jgi:hypothetical protein